MAKTPEMTADFARWYTETFMDEGKTRLSRWKGVVDTAENADHITVEILVRYAFATVAPADGGKNEIFAKGHSEFLATISGSSSPMDPATSRRELQVLAAAVLMRLFSTLPDAAITVLNASSVGSRTTDLPMDLVGLAKRALVDFAKTKHRRPDVKEFKVEVPKVEFEVSPDALTNMQPNIWKNELERLRDVAQTTARMIVEQQNRVSELLVRQVSLGEEELQMLWWLIGSHSNLTGTPFNEVAAASRPLVFGYELGLLTNVSPGPASIRSLLYRTGLSNEVLKIKDAANSADVNWIKEITSSRRVSPVTTPLHFALEKRVEVGSDDAWLPLWASMTGLPTEASMSEVELSELFYREYLFLHVSG